MFFDPNIFRDNLCNQYNSFPIHRFSRIITPMKNPPTPSNGNVPSIVTPSPMPKKDTDVIETDMNIEKLSNELNEEYKNEVTEKFKAKYATLELDILVKKAEEKEELYKMMSDNMDHGVVTDEVHKEFFYLGLKLRALKEHISERKENGENVSEMKGKNLSVKRKRNNIKEGEWISKRGSRKNETEPEVELNDNKKNTSKEEDDFRLREEDIGVYLNDNDYTPPNHQPSLSDMEMDVEEDNKSSSKGEDELPEVPVFFQLSLVQNYVLYCLKRKWSKEFGKKMDNFPESFTHNDIEQWAKKKREYCDIIRLLLSTAKMETMLNELLDIVGEKLRDHSNDLTYLEEILGGLKLVETQSIEWNEGPKGSLNKKSAISGLEMHDDEIIMLTLKNPSNSDKPLKYIFECAFMPLINSYYRVCHLPSLILSLFETWSNEENEQRTEDAFNLFVEMEGKKIVDLINKMCFIIQDNIEQITGKHLGRWYEFNI